MNRPSWIALLVFLAGCSPPSPSKPGPGPKPPVVEKTKNSAVK